MTAGTLQPSWVGFTAQHSRVDPLASSLLDAINDGILKVALLGDVIVTNELWIIGSIGALLGFDVGWWTSLHGLGKDVVTLQIVEKPEDAKE